MSGSIDEFTNGDNHLTEKQLKMGYWLTVNRPKLYQALIIFLIVFNVAFGGYSLYKWGDYLVNGYLADQAMLKEISRPLTNFKNLKEHFAAKQIVIEGVNTFVSGAKVDAVALLNNPNNDFIVRFDYDFVFGGGKTELRRAFLLPNESRPVTELGIKDLNGEANIEIKNIDWERISNHKIKNPRDYISQRKNFETGNFKFTPAVALGLTENRISFNVFNNSLFSYWQVDLVVLLKNGESVIGAEVVGVDNFKSEEKRLVELAIDPRLYPTSIEVYPSINVFDEKVYSK